LCCRKYIGFDGRTSALESILYLNLAQKETISYIFMEILS